MFNHSRYVSLNYLLPNVQLNCLFFIFPAICQSEAPPSCFNTFRNGVCDRRCDNEEGMYDGFDCVPPVRDCSPIFNSYCTKHFDNSRCDPRCNSAGCSWDGGDCVTKGRGYVKGTVVLMVAHKPEALKKVLVQFLRSMSKLLRTIVRIRIEKHSHDGIRPWHTQATEPGASSPVHVRGYVSPNYKSFQFLYNTKSTCTKEMLILNLWNDLARK